MTRVPRMAGSIVAGGAVFARWDMLRGIEAVTTRDRALRGVSFRGAPFTRHLLERGSRTIGAVGGR
jgi:hypothetical protein